jgi:hypothetical protein
VREKAPVILDTSPPDPSCLSRGWLITQPAS